MNRRKYLTQSEVDMVLAEAKKGRFAERDYCLLYLSFVHGFRVSEVCSLQITDICMHDRSLFIRRMKNGFSTTHPLLPEGLRALESWLQARHQMAGSESNWLFVSRQGGPITRQRVWQVLQNLGRKAGISVDAHPHMLRHACGFALANQGVDTRLIQDYLGHRNIRHTVCYTASNPERFKSLWTKNKHKVNN